MRATGGSGCECFRIVAEEFQSVVGVSGDQFLAREKSYGGEMSLPPAEVEEAGQQEPGPAADEAAEAGGVAVGLELSAVGGDGSALVRGSAVGASPVTAGLMSPEGGDELTPTLPASILAAKEAKERQLAIEKGSRQTIFADETETPAGEPEPEPEPAVADGDLSPVSRERKRMSDLGAQLKAAEEEMALITAKKEGYSSLAEKYDAERLAAAEAARAKAEAEAEAARAEAEAEAEAKVEAKVHSPARKIFHTDPHRNPHQHTNRWTPLYRPAGPGKMGAGKGGHCISACLCCSPERRG